MNRLLCKTLVASFLAAALAVTGLAVATDPAGAAFPGANGKIAFTSNRDSGGIGLGEIYVMNADGSGQTRLTFNSAHDDDAAWSPDGQKIAFASSRDGNFEIYVMNADGSGVTRLTFDPETDSNPTWSPDGQKIAFASTRDGDDEIHVMNADGSGVTQLTVNSDYDDEPVWSPDGQKIAFTSGRDGNPEIYVMNADGSAQANLTNNAGYDAEADWSPTGQKIAYEGGLGGITVMNADGTGKINVSGTTSADANPAWSPDGQKIAFASDRDETFFEVYAVNADGSGTAQRLTFAAFSDLPGDWQPIVVGEPVDTVPPTVTCDTPMPVYVLGGSHAADVTATVTDSDSGPAASPVAADVTAADVATVGVKSKTLTGADNAGNTTTVSCPFLVGYQFGGFLEPLPQQKNKAGSRIPVKFTLLDASGATISDAEALSLVGNPCRIRVLFAGAPQAGCPSYDPVANVFQYDVKTAKNMPAGSQTIAVEISAPDGSGLLQTHTIQVSIV